MPRKPYKTWGITHEKIPFAAELFASEEGKRLLQQAFNPPKIEEMLDSLETQAKKVLCEHKLDENWMAHSATPLEKLPEQAYHCIEILTRMDRTRHWIRENNVRMAVTETIHMMNAVADSMITFFESDIYRGKMLLEKASQGGKEKNSNNGGLHSLWQRQAEKIWQANPKFSARSVAQAIAQRTGYKAETVRHHIKRPKK